MNILAVIPARGGSKGVPRKNIRPLCGKPLIGWSIEAARKSAYVNRVVVSTDDAEIANVSVELGAEVVWRPAELSGDGASSESALLHVLDHLRWEENYEPDYLAFLQCTSPLTDTEDIDGTISACLQHDADTALAVKPFHYFLWRSDEGGNATGINHNKSVRLLRQQRQPEYQEAGSVYVMRSSGLIEHRHRFFGKTVFYVAPLERCIEIDEEVDFKVTEMLMRERQRQRRVESLPDHLGGIALDFDGVFTNNLTIVSQDGTESVVCDRADGLGLRRLRETGVPLIVISTEVNPVVKARCDKLQIDCLHGIHDKLPVLRDWAAKRGVDLSQLIYVGNDVNDIDCLKASGCPIAVADAHADAACWAKIVLSCSGGRGALRELADLIDQKRRASAMEKGVVHA